MIRKLKIAGITPFGNLEIKFPPVVNKPEDCAETYLITGINGTGKTRLLSIIATILGSPQSFQARMKGFSGNASIRFSDQLDSNENGDSLYEINNSSISLSRVNKAHTWASSVPAFAYSGVPYVTDSQISALTAVAPIERKDALSFIKVSGQSSGLLQAIVNLKVQAAMDNMDFKDDKVFVSRPIELVNVLERTISEITGKRFKFTVSRGDTKALKAYWGNDELLFDVMPDGLRSIIGWIAHAVVMFDLTTKGANPGTAEAVFLLDEIESHLHPAWQRKILPAFQKIFPKSQIFVVTHSPFVISSISHGWIYKLKQNKETGVVSSEAPIEASLGDSYVSVVEDIMGLQEWYDQETESLLEEFRKAKMRAYSGESAAFDDAMGIAAKISNRGPELKFMITQEVNQLIRQVKRDA